MKKTLASTESYPVKEDYSVVERRRTRRKSRERSSISEYNVLDIDESKKGVQQALNIMF